VSTWCRYWDKPVHRIDPTKPGNRVPGRWRRRSIKADCTVLSSPFDASNRSCCCCCCDQRHPLPLATAVQSIDNRCNWLLLCVCGTHTSLIKTKLYMAATLLLSTVHSKAHFAISLRLRCNQWRIQKIFLGSKWRQDCEDSEKTRWIRRGRKCIPSPVQWWELDERRKLPWWKLETSTVENGYVSFREHSENSLVGILFSSTGHSTLPSPAIKLVFCTILKNCLSQPGKQFCHTGHTV